VGAAAIASAANIEFKREDLMNRNRVTTALTGSVPARSISIIIPWPDANHNYAIILNMGAAERMGVVSELSHRAMQR
jgi:hypothetical protein